MILFANKKNISEWVYIFLTTAASKFIWGKAAQKCAGQIFPQSKELLGTNMNITKTRPLLDPSPELLWMYEEVILNVDAYRKCSWSFSTSSFSNSFNFGGGGLLGASVEGLWGVLWQFSIMRWFHSEASSQFPVCGMCFLAPPPLMDFYFEWTCFSPKHLNPIIIGLTLHIWVTLYEDLCCTTKQLCQEGPVCQTPKHPWLCAETNPLVGALTRNPEV